MAVYTKVSLEQARAFLAQFPAAGELRDLQGISAGSINTMYRADTDDGPLWLRINEGKARAAIDYEVALLQRLPAPSLLRAQNGDRVRDLAGKPAMLFAHLEGDEPSDIQVDQLRALGAGLAKVHVALRSFRGGRANPFGFSTLACWFANMRGQIERRLEDKIARHLRACSRARKQLPRGVVHGDLFPNNTKWHGGELLSIFDWEMAGRDHLALDLGVCINAWCFEGGAFSREKIAALIAGYESVRELRAVERRGLLVEAKVGALRFLLSRIRDFELNRGADATRDYLDYRDYEARLDALSSVSELG